MTLRSMTGFGRSTIELDGQKYEIELKILNSRFREFIVKTPRKFSAQEFAIRNIISESIHRGKIEFSIAKQLKSLIDSSSSISSTFNRDRYNWFLELYTKIKSEQKQSSASGYEPLTESEIFFLLSQPQVILSEKESDFETSLTEDGIKVLLAGVSEAISSALSHREAEGRAIKAQLLSLLDEISATTDTLKSNNKLAPQEMLERLKSRIEQLSTDGVSEERIAQELVMCADKVDVSEEITRLGAHLERFRSKIDDNPVGRELEFICQELLRESNTIGSKSSEIGLVIDMKLNLEKIREQIQNVE